ncbi:hypothetical protein NMY22_g17613 [Coprinellus aureogranulatus]|nr:hypothetical protein NMY22_g17613 [Coprinellus aureogranulatus]
MRPDSAKKTLAGDGERARGHIYSVTDIRHCKARSSGFLSDVGAAQDVLGDSKAWEGDIPYCDKLPAVIYPFYVDPRHAEYEASSGKCLS